MNSENTGRGPSFAELQKFIRDKRQIEMMLLTGQKICGTLKWFDEQAYCIILDGGETITLVRSAVIGYRTVSGHTAAPQAARKA